MGTDGGGRKVPLIKIKDYNPPSLKKSWDNHTKRKAVQIHKKKNTKHQIPPSLFFSKCLGVILKVIIFHIA